MGRLQERRGFADKHSDEPMKTSRILISAIILSAVWHIFWISAVTVVVVPKAPSKSVKFSSVSFLGPILEQGMLKVSVAPHELSASEKEYLSHIENLSGAMNGPDVKDPYVEAGIDSSLPIVISVLDDRKIEPGRAVEG